jgi:hypothetical protein
MYNGQFAKGIVHLVIFGLLTFLSENVNSIFGLFVAGWMFYMVFEAYHTAAARRDGLPLPNAFGFNDIGERMGFGKTWYAPGGARAGAAATAEVPPVQAAQAQAAQAAASTPPVYQTGYAPVNYVPVGTAPDWVGYVPPTAFSGNAAVATAPITAPMTQAARDAGFSSTAYAETYTGPVQPPYAAPAAATVTPVEVPARRIPSGAFWLIGLGVLILIANLLPDWKLTEQWWPPLLFAGLSVWLFTRRLRSGVPLVCILRWPVVLMVLAVMLALHAASAPVTAGVTLSVLLIVFGALLLLERTAGVGQHAAPPIDPYAGSVYGMTPPVEGASSRAAWTAPVDVASGVDAGSQGVDRQEVERESVGPHNVDSQKGGE